MLRQNDILNFLIALSMMGLTMLWGKPKKETGQRDAANAAEDNDAGGENYLIAEYNNWDASEAEYQRDERKFWRHQVRTAYWNLGLSILTFTIAITGAVIAGGAYLQTVRQANEAKRQADIAQTQLNNAQIAEVRQLRAYLVAISARFDKDDSGKLKYGLTDKEGRHELLIYYEISNEGQTPAYEVEKSVDWQFPFTGVVDFRYTDGLPGYIAKKQTFGPVRTKYFTDDEVKLIESGEQPFVFAGRIWYNDIFGNRWPTFYCFLYAKRPVEPGFDFCPRYSHDDRLNYAR